MTVPERHCKHSDQALDSGRSAPFGGPSRIAMPPKATLDSLELSSQFGRVYIPRRCRNDEATARHRWLRAGRREFDYGKPSVTEPQPGISINPQTAGIRAA